MPCKWCSDRGRWECGYNPCGGGRVWFSAFTIDDSGRETKLFPTEDYVYFDLKEAGCECHHSERSDGPFLQVKLELRLEYVMGIPRPHATLTPMRCVDEIPSE
jgi:hypothetical protein